MGKPDQLRRLHLRAYAIRLYQTGGVEMTALDIIEAAAECIGVPFRHQGRSIEPGPGQGIDCVGLAVHVARSLGL